MPNIYFDDDSLPFQCDLDITEGKRYLMSDIFPAIGRDQNKKQFLAARVLIANLLYVATTDHMTIGIPRGNGAICTTTPNNPHKITTYLIKCHLHDLEKRQFFQIKKGFFNQLKNEGKVTRYTLTDSFIEFIQIIGLQPFDYEKIEKPESLLILKDSINKNSIVYEDNEETTSIKNNLVALNRLIQTTDIKIEADPLGKDYFCRVFNRGSFKLGGRFYSIKLTNLKKAKRKKITANGIPLIELDFKQMQPSLLLNSLRKKSNGDIYHFGNDFKLETVPKGRYKEIAKTAFLIMLNTRRKKDAICTIDYDLQEKGIAEKYGSIIVDALIKRHKNIEIGLFKDSGIKFMNIESQIAEKIIMHFVNKGKIIVPIHDAFLVTEADKQELKAMMISAYNQVIMEHYGMISVSPEIEQK